MLCCPLTLQAVKSRSNKDMSPAQAKRKRQAMARVTEAIMFFLNAANTSAALLVPCVVVAKTPTADPLPAAALTMMVGAWTCCICLHTPRCMLAAVSLNRLKACMDQTLLTAAFDMS